MRNLFLSFLAIAAFGTMPVAGKAVADECRRLENSLARLERGSGSPGSSRLADAERRQEEALRLTMRDARRGGCTSGSYTTDPYAGCRQVRATIRAMKSNLKKIRRRLARAGGGNTDRRVRRIRARMASLGCGGSGESGGYASAGPDRERSTSTRRRAFEEDGRLAGRRRWREDEAPPARRRRGLFAMLFPGSRRDDEDEDYGDVRRDSGTYSGTGTDYRRRPPREFDPFGDDDAERRLRSSSIPNGKYRTMCVRTCDGYYFPISFAARPDDFGRDERICQGMCPGQDVRLFYLEKLDEKVAEMVSLDGEPYAETNSAFRYRKKFDKSCTCGKPTLRTVSLPHDGTDAKTGGMSAATADGRNRLASLRPALSPPGQKPPAGVDPETAADIRAGFTPRPVRPGSLARARYTVRNGVAIREVGPTTVLDN